MCRSCRIVAQVHTWHCVCCLHPPVTYILHFSPCYPSPTSPLPPPLLSLTWPPPTDPSAWWSPPCFHVLSFFNTRLSQFAENYGLQIHPCSYKGQKLIIFYGCIVFHGVHVPHFPCSVYHRWAFGLVLGLCYCEQCCSEHSCACVLIVERSIILRIYTQ